MSELIHKIQIPFPPSVNSLWRIGRGRMFRSKKYTAFMKLCDEEIIWEKKPPIDYKIEIEVVVGRPRNKDGSVTKVRMDIDNRLKSCLDVIEHIGVYIDDCLIEKITAMWSTDFTHTEIRIWRYEN